MLTDHEKLLLVLIDAINTDSMRDTPYSSLRTWNRQHLTEMSEDAILTLNRVDLTQDQRDYILSTTGYPIDW